MKKKIIVLALFVLLISGCGSKIPTLSNGDEAVVTLKKGSMMVSANELYQAVKGDYALETMVNLVDKKILEDKYKDKVEEAQKAADNTITEYESYYGDQLLSLIQQQTGYQTIESFKEYLYIKNLQQYAIDDYCKAQISDKEIKKYYNDEIVGDIKVNHILITAKVKDNMTDEEKAAAETAAKKKVESIISELNKTDKKEVATKFAELAKAQSEDDSTKDNGGSLGWINKDTLSSEYDELVTAAYKLKDGEYSTSVITTEQGYHVILRNGTKDKASLEDSKDKIVKALSDKYLKENPVANVKALQEIRKEYKLEIVDSELKEQYATYIQNQISYYQQSVSTN
jgi:foldase protein PrsA